MVRTIESVVEFGHVAIQVFLLDLMVCADQESLQIRQGDVNSGQEAVRLFILPGDGRCSAAEAIFSVSMAVPSVG